MDRATRQKCWDARDSFFKCLDSNEIIDPTTISTTSPCQSQKAAFKKDCVATWVDYFSKKRVLEIQRERMIKEAERRGANILSADDVRHPAGRRDST